MNFNVHFNDNLVEEIKAMMASTGKKRNAIIQEAVKDFIKPLS